MHHMHEAWSQRRPCRHSYFSMDLQRKTGDPIIDLAHQHCRGSIAAESLATIAAIGLLVRAVVERLVLIEWHWGLLLLAGGIFIIFIIIIAALLIVLAELALFVAPLIGPPLLPLLSSSAGP